MATNTTNSTVINSTARAAELDCGESGVLGIDVRGTFVGTLQFEGTMNGTDWFAIPFFNPSIGTQAVVVTSATGVGAWVSGAAGIIKLRVRFSAYTSGAAVVTLRGEDRGLPFIIPTGSASLIVTPSAASPTSSGFGTHYHLISAASTNATSVKSSAGLIGTITVSNASAAVKYFKLYNKATAPAVGTDVPIMTLLVPAGQTVVYSNAQGLRIPLGIAIALTGGVTVADVTAVALNDLAVHIDYV